jgi:signal transduction histidine kinase
MKTPLTSIKAYAQLVERSLEQGDVEQGKKFIQKTSEFVTRMERLIGDLLDVSKIQSSKMPYTMQVFEFNSLAEDVAESLQHISKTHRLKFVRGNNINVRADKQRIEQVLNNIISNAVKYSPGADEVVMRVMAEEEQVHVTITDRGLGIPKEKLPHIFDRFFRVYEMPSISGLGIGLFITKEIITRHGGSIWAESEPGKGSTFHFTLPSADSGPEVLS